jgi:hypothetical protein
VRKIDLSGSLAACDKQMFSIVWSIHRVVNGIHMRACAMQGEVSSRQLALSLTPITDEKFRRERTANIDINTKFSQHGQRSVKQSAQGNRQEEGQEP